MRLRFMTAPAIAQQYHTLIISDSSSALSVGVISYTQPTGTTPVSTFKTCTAADETVVAQQRSPAVYARLEVKAVFYLRLYLVIGLTKCMKNV